MVDALDRQARLVSAAPGPLAPQPGLSVRVEGGVEALAGYRAFTARAVHSPSQSPAWVSGWVRETGADILVATVLLDEAPVLAVALQVARRHGIMTAAFPGGSHANGNFPALDPAGTALPDGIAAMIAAELRHSRQDLDLMALERLEPVIGGHANPLIGPASPASPDIALAVGLEGGFDAVLARHSGKRKRKKHRNHARKFDEQGGHRTVLARDARQAGALLDAFFAMKARRFAQMGVADVFADARVQRFFHGLAAASAARAQPEFVVHGLEVGGRIRAVTGSSICGEHMICEFSGFVPDATKNTSPGEYLFFENIRWACEQGLAVHDFSVGDEPYKRLWCDIETVQRDTLVALSPAGNAALLARRALGRVKRSVKSAPALMALIRKVRRQH